jgi:hypothetical protein
VRYSTSEGRVNSKFSALYKEEDTKLANTPAIIAPLDATNRKHIPSVIIFGVYLVGLTYLSIGS